MGDVIFSNSGAAIKNNLAVTYVTNLGRRATIQQGNNNYIIPSGVQGNVTPNFMDNRFDDSDFKTKT